MEDIDFFRRYSVRKSNPTPEGRLFTRLHQRSIKSREVIDFLEHLLACIAGKLLIIWDGAPIHKSKAIQAFLCECHQKEPGRLLLERLPGYSPELNPQEGIWRYLKYEEMPNLCCPTMEHLKYEFILVEEWNKSYREQHHLEHVEEWVGQDGRYLLQKRTRLPASATPTVEWYIPKKE